MTELWKRSATEVVALLKKREISPSELVDVAARRVAETNPAINAMVTLCLDRARDHAKRLEAQPIKEAPANYLHGLPIAVKDNTDVEGVRCTYGSRVYENRVSPATDLVVQRL